MSNYEHEIICPGNKGVLNYLWFDYFHDSNISNICYEKSRGSVSITLECCSEISELWHKLNHDEDIFQAYLEKNIERFSYILTFKGTRYFHTERLLMQNDYLYGRFKDTALLKKLMSESRKQLYHFRIGIDDGFMDIIFSDFVIRKKAGRVKYSIKEIPCQIIDALTDDEKRIALRGNDNERFFVMQKLFKTNDPDLIELARQIFQMGNEPKHFWVNSCFNSYLYAVYLLGKLGDTSDIPKLFDLLLNVEEYFVLNSMCRCDALIVKREIMDAIELIKYREDC